MARINQTVQATFTDDPAAGGLRYGLEFEPAWDETYLKNHIQINGPDVSGRTGSGVAVDASSTTDYGIIVDTFDSPMVDGGERQALAEYRLYLYSQPKLRLPALQLMGAVNPVAAWPAILGLDIGDAIDVARFDNLAGEMNMSLNVEGMRLSGSPGEPLNVAVTTSPRDSRTYWQSEHATLGTVETGNLVAP